MTDQALPRPRQVTMAAGMVIAGSLLVVLSVFDQVSGLNDLDTREGIERFLTRPPGDGLGLTVQDALDTIRVFAMIAGACAAAAAILGVHVLRRHRGARIGLTVLAVPLFVSGLVAGGFLSSIVAAAVMMLWLEPSRDWFAGRPARTPPEPVERSGRTDGRSAPPATELPPAAPVSTGPRAHQGFGTAGAAPQETGQDAGQYAGQYAVPAYAPPAYSPQVVPYGPPVRPRSVLTAAVITWVGTGLAALLMGAAALLTIASPDLMWDEMVRQNSDLTSRDGLTQGNVQATVVAMSAVVVLWSLVAAGLAGFLVARRRAWARTGLMVSALLVGLFCSAGVALGAVVMIVPLAACSATFSLLLRRDVRAWVTAP